jgi:hypothetical protein
LYQKYKGKLLDKIEKWLGENGKYFHHNKVYSYSLGYKRPMFRKAGHEDFGLGAHVIFGSQWVFCVRLAWVTLTVESDTIPF